MDDAHFFFLFVVEVVEGFSLVLDVVVVVDGGVGVSVYVVVEELEECHHLLGFYFFL